jgi:hypothetical protein
MARFLGDNLAILQRNHLSLFPMRVKSNWPPMPPMPMIASQQHRGANAAACATSSRLAGESGAVAVVGEVIKTDDKLFKRSWVMLLL